VIPVKAFSIINSMTLAMVTMTPAKNLSQVTTKFFAGVNDTSNETIAKTSAFLHLKMNIK
jgi:hypothetical protein